MATVATRYLDLPARSASRTAPTRGMLARIVDAFIKARQAEAERQVARLVEAHGHRLTDDLERRIVRHFV